MSTTAADNLNSKQYLTVVDLISEGEIVGLVNGNKSIYLNNTPLQNANGSYNFVNPQDPSWTSSITKTTGTQTQSYIALTTDIENEIPIGTVVEQAVPIIRTITNPNVDTVRITLSWPQLQLYKTNGDIVGSTVQFIIEVQYAGAGFQQVIGWTNGGTVTGRTGDVYQTDFLIALNGSFPVDIRVTRSTGDSTNPQLIDAFSWSSYTEITNLKLNYPHSALIAMRLDAEQFNSIPSRAYRVRGVKLSIPSNAIVDSTTGALIYSGTWSGTFATTKQWTSDPAWVLWDLLTSKRYGFGDFISASQLDKWAFLSASQYASALNTYTSSSEIADRAARGLAPRTGTTNDYDATTGKHGIYNGLGNYEPRFSCNANIQTAEDAYKVINDLCSVFRSQPFWSTGSVTITQDAPKAPSYQFTLANVTEEGFSYQSSSLKNRPTVAVVSYLDLNRRDVAYEVVEATNLNNQNLVATYGVTTKQIAAFATTSRAQANRLGRWLLYSEWMESEIVSFTTSIDAGVVVRPGQIIQISDPLRAGARRGGRINSATTSTVTVDDATGLTSGASPTLSVVMPDGSVATSTVASISGNTLTVSPAFSTAPNPNSVWVYQTSDLQATTWRVLAVQEQDSSHYVVSALAYAAGKFDYVENGVALQARDVTDLDVAPAAPTNLVFAEQLYLYQGQVRSKIIASWKPVLGVNQYRILWRKDSGNWASVTKQGPDFEVLDITPGFFEFQVYSLSATLKTSTTALTGSITALGKTAPPSDVTGFAYSVSKDIGVTLSWNAISDIDLAQYEIRRGTSWSSSTLVAQIKGTSYKMGYLDDGSYSYLIKAVDTSGSYSVNAASIAISVVPPNSTTISSTIQANNLVLSWAAPTITTYDIAYYRVTYGDSYASSVELAKPQSTSFLVPVTWTGSRTFYVVPVDLVGKYYDPPASKTITITNATAPSVTASFYGRSCTLNWTPVSGTLPTAFYEVAYGSSFASRTVIAKVSADGSAYSTPASWAGSQTFYVTAMDGNGNYGATGSVVATISKAPAPTITSVFTGGNVTLSWAAVKGTLEVAYYEIRLGATFATATVIGTSTSNNYTTKVTWSGTTTKLWVVAVDITGLYGAGGS